MIRKVLWYLCRPRYYGECIRMCREEVRHFFSRPKRRREVVIAQSWCRGQSISKQEASSYLATRRNINVAFSPLSVLHSQDLSDAEQRVRQSGAKMGGGSSLDLLYSLTQGIAAENVVETGVAYGWSSLAFLLALEKRVSGRLWSVDKPYPGSGTEQFVGCAVPKRLHARWTLLKGTDRIFLPQAIREAGVVDLCHYDSDKSYLGRMWAYPKLWAALRRGGIFISDDIGDNLAFRDFCMEIGEKPLIVEEGKGRYLGILVKT